LIIFFGTDSVHSLVQDSSFLHHKSGATAVTVCIIISTICNSETNISWIIDCWCPSAMAVFKTKQL